MRAFQKICFLVAGVCIALGLVLSLGALAVAKFDLMSLLNRAQTLPTQVVTYPVDHAFSRIVVDTMDAQVQLLPSPDGTCRVECSENEELTYQVSVSDDTLTIQAEVSRPWFNHLVSITWSESQVVVYLPEQTYESLAISTASADVTVPENFTFSSVQVETGSGNIQIAAPVQDTLSAQSASGLVSVSQSSPRSLEAHTVSGNLELSQLQCEQLTATSTSGGVVLSDIQCTQLTTENTSGKTLLTQVRASGSIQMDSISGDLQLTGCDASSLRLQSISGDISGSLLSSKMFSTHTTSGDVSVPQSATGGTCDVTTVSGSISFQ